MARVQALGERLPVPVDVEELVTIRADLAGMTSRGRISPGGSCRLLHAADGWVAVNLARSGDVEALPAVVQAPIGPGDPWTAVERFVREHPATLAADRFQLLEVPAAVLADPRVDATGVVLHRLGEAATAGAGAVVDLSAMWAGPLCAQLLGRSGLDVVKVESTSRPDGARFGEPRFFDWLHAGKEQLTVDLSTSSGRERLVELVEAADVVVESSRPRALAQFGLTPEAYLGARPGRTWVSITGYGRSGDAAQKVAFGDDAAVAGGLVARDDGGEPIFCGDAIADPLSGLAAAAGALRSIDAGGGNLAEVSMASVARSVSPPPR